MFQLKIDRYHFINTSPDKTAMGMIAQEAKVQFPELVKTTNGKDEQHPNEFADHHAINYANFSIITIKVIQEQQTEIEALKKDNQSLKKTAEELKAMVLSKR